jgi:sugar lactone lactonase YvrE
MRSAIPKTALSAFTAALLGATLHGGPAQAATRPGTFPLPNGFQPEGIAIAGGHAYFGSRATGDIYRADLRTGRGKVITKGPGTPSLGLETDGRGRLFVAGGSGGDARVVDLRTGKVLKSYRLATGTSFVNDVIIAGGAVYFTDSSNPVLYKLDLGRGGRLPEEAVKIPLSGAIQYGDGINANGIVRSPDGRSLLIVQSNTGKLFEVNPKSGATTEVRLGDVSLVNGDGLLLSGRTLYAVQNWRPTAAPESSSGGSRIRSSTCRPRSPPAATCSTCPTPASPPPPAPTRRTTSSRSSAERPPRDARSRPGELSAAGHSR